MARRTDDERGREPHGSLPLPVLAYTALLAAGGASLAISNAARDVRAVPWGLVPALGALLAVAAALVVRVSYRDQVMALDLFEAVLAVAIVALPGHYVAVVVAASLLVVESGHGVRAHKTAFNLAQWSVAAGTGALVFGVLRDGSALSPRTVGALVAAMTVIAVVNTMAFSFVIRLAEGQAVRRVLASLAPSILLGWAANTTFGLLFVAAYRWHPAGLALVPVPLALLHGTYRAYSAVAADRARLRGLNEAARALAEPIDPREAFPRFLGSVRSTFDAAAVELVLAQDGGRLVHRAERGGRQTSRLEVEDDTIAAALVQRGATPPSRAPELAPLLAREGMRECLVAPVIVEGRVAGALAVFDRSGPEGFEEGERAVLEALASQAADAVRKGVLFSEILEERRKLMAVVNHTSDGILALDETGRILLWNPGLEEVSGYAAVEMVGTRSVDLLRARDERGADVRLDRWADVGLPSALLQVTTRAGDGRWVSCACTRVADPRGSDLLVVVARDVTKAREVERLKDDFIATVSHELRTPLTPIVGWAELLVRAGDRIGAADRDEAARAIKRQAEHLQELVANLLEVSNVEQDASRRRGGSLDGNIVVATVASAFRRTAPDREFRLELTPGRARAHGDELWVEQILTNLVSNAVKYSPPGEPVVLRVHRTNGWVKISVTDRGPGIPAAERERIFDRFHRLGDAATRAQSGTGLGLYIARQMATALDGAILIESAPGEGATFTLRLRAAGRLATVG